MILFVLLVYSLNINFVLSGGGCFAQNKPGTPQVIGPSVENCHDAVSYIPTGTAKSEAPIVFSHDAKIGYKVN